MNSIIQDVRHAWRMMRKSPGFTLFGRRRKCGGFQCGQVKSVLLDPLPYPDSNRLVQISFNQPGAGLNNVPCSGPELEHRMMKYISSTFLDSPKCVY